MAPSAKWQRVQAALEGGVADRPPFAFWMHFPHLDRDPRELARATVDLYRRYHMDFIKVMFRSSWGVEDWGCVFDRYHPTRGYWIAATYAVRSPEDWRRLRPLDPRQGALGEQLQVLRMVREAVGDEAPILATLFAPSMLAAHLAGQETFVQHLRQAPEAVEAGLRTISATLQDFARACLENGADGIFYATQLASRRVLADEEYRHLGRTFDRPVLESFHPRSRFTMLHIHGEQLMFDEVSRYPAHALNWYDRNGCPSLGEARASVQTCLAGGIDHERTLMLGLPQEVAAEVRAAVAELGGRGLMLAPGCGVPCTVPGESLRALAAAATGEL
ncbi:MAG TPA: uroporphyrinogen decarboxylase family protein [Chloroflexota bacterium]